MASALFGHVKGAFTGAEAKHQGLFTAADKSTLFLDEVAETSLEIQAMLLRVLEVGEVQPLGSNLGEVVDVRVIAATDAAIHELITQRRFREPLLHRLAGFQIELPALKDRRDDVARLLVHFLRQELAALGDEARLDNADIAAPLWLPSLLLTRLTRYDWPGNVRELRNVARHIVICNRDRSRVVDDDFLKALRNTPAPLDGLSDLAREGKAKTPAQKEPSASIDDERLIATLAKHQWRTSAAATELNVSRTTLYAMMERCPGVRKAKDLSAEELGTGLESVGGDLDALSTLLKVSKRGIQLRLKELKLGNDSGETP